MIRAAAALAALLALAGCQVDDDFAACKMNLSAIRLMRPAAERDKKTDEDEKGWFLSACMGSRGYSYRTDDEACIKDRFDSVLVEQACFEQRGVIRTTRLFFRYM